MKKTHIVKVGNVQIGGQEPIVVQSMTDTPTADIQATTKQIMQLSDAGSEIVRITVNDEKAANAVPQIVENLKKNNYDTPIAGCFHFNGHRLLQNSPECAEALSKFRINPGNVGFGRHRDTNFEQFIELAIKHNKPVRIGVNWGSLDQSLLAKLMDENAKLSNPLSANGVMQNALVKSALESAKKAESIGLSANQIIISCKVSKVPELIKVYEMLNAQCDYALHLGLTEAGMGEKGIISSTAALAILLNRGIGNTIRCSLTPAPGASRTKEVEICRSILQSLGLREFTPEITSCPGCGRTSSDFFRKLTEDVQQKINQKMVIWQKQYPAVKSLKIAVMGCIVNGPGESKHADIGISLPGDGEDPAAPVFIDGQKVRTLRGKKIAEEFEQIIDEYVAKKYSNSTNTKTENSKAF